MIVVQFLAGRVDAVASALLCMLKVLVLTRAVRANGYTIAEWSINELALEVQ